MDLNLNNKLEEYYQKFIELQEKLKKSEEQRFMMEMKFNEMVQVAKEEEQAHYRKLRSQYKKFLEEDQKRQDRNEHIIRNLERIEAKISMLSAKTERINLFRSQYQKYLRRIANSYPEKKNTYSKISRERSFIKEEQLKEQQSTMFRDDYSLPSRPKDTSINMDKDKLLYEHPSVMKSLEKDRSNEEKIEILDKYLQSISSQKCRDVLNQEKQAREKLSFDTPIDKGFANDFTMHSTNHATAVADDIMNSIYSRYYTKAEVIPKGNKVDLPKDMPSENKDTSDYFKREFKPEDKTYSNAVFNKPIDGPLEKINPTVTFKERENLPKDNREVIVPEKRPGDKLSNDFKNTSNESYHFQDKNKQELLPEGPDPTQDLLKHVAENTIGNKNSIDHTTKFTIKDLKTETDQNEKLIINNSVENEDKSLINSEKEFNNNLPFGNNIKDIDSINEDPCGNIVLEEHKNNVLYDPSNNIIENSSPQVLPHDQSEYNTVKEDQLQRKDQIKEQPQEQCLKSQEPEQLLEYVHSDPIYPTEEPYYPEGHSEQLNQQNEDELYNKTTNDNKNSFAYQDTNENNQNGQLTGHEAYDNQDQSPLQYIQNNESGQPIQYDPLSNQPYEQNQSYDQSQHYENAQPNQYTPSDQSPLQYDENSVQPAQFEGTGQPTEFAENDSSYQPIQYDESGRAPIQYDENGQPIGYDQYGQPLMYDQNGQIVQPQYDENGQLVPQYDENGQIMMLYDHSGQLLFDGQYKNNQQYDLNDQPMQYDENGQPIYDQSQQQYYDYTNQEQVDPASGYNQYQGDEQGQYIESQEEQMNAPLENTENHFQTEESNNYNQVGDHQGSYANADGGLIEGGDQYQDGTEYDHHQGQENIGAMQDVNNEQKQNVEAGEESEAPNNEIAKPKVMDILDTDTESTKQNASKISTESDFDFN